jgi:hypothetical protein
MKRNITLKVDAELLREARVLAAEEGRSVSALVTDRIEEMVRERKAFDKARRRALARLREGLDLRWTRPKTRDELHLGRTRGPGGGGLGGGGVVLRGSLAWPSLCRRASG